MRWRRHVASWECAGSLAPLLVVATVHAADGLDWVMDVRGNVSLLECNAAPGMLDYSYIEGDDALKPSLWTSMLHLVALAQAASMQRLRSMTVQRGFRFAGWELLYNELTSPQVYNTCSTPLSQPA
eukprot:7146597-Prymnesium_polylepis.1